MPQNKYPRIPVLVYHKIAEPSAFDANPNTCVTPAAFGRQMRTLRLLGYRSADHAEYLKARKGLPAALPGKPVLITFDDAFESVLTEALPVMKACGFSGTVFMVSSALGGSASWDGETAASPNRLLGPDGLKVLLNEGWLIGSHGVTHRDHRTLSGPELSAEASRSKSELEAALGSEIGWFAYPYGGDSPEARSAAEAAGYATAFSTEQGAGGLFSVPRRIISGKSGLLNFLLRLRQAGRLSLS